MDIGGNLDLSSVSLLHIKFTCLTFFMKGLMFVIWCRKVLVASCMHHKHGIVCKYSVEQYSIDKKTFAIL